MQQRGGAMGIAILGTVFFSAAASSGLVHAFHTTLRIEVGVLVVTAGLAALLPMRARAGEHP
jgi:hypothetical protein